MRKKWVLELIDLCTERSYGVIVRNVVALDSVPVISIVFIDKSYFVHSKTPDTVHVNSILHT